ncbi:hypothetical protein CaCOL14_009388 [Colletotrichum acutatum]
MFDDGISDREDSVAVDDGKVASDAKLSVAVAAFVVDAKVVDDNIFGKSVATDMEVRSEIGVELKELVLWLAWMEGGPDIVLVTKSEEVEDGNIEELLVGSALPEDATVVPARDVVLKEKVLFVNEVLVLGSRLVRRSENVPLELDVENVVESEEVNVTSVPVLESSSVVELLLKVGMSVDDREVADKTDVTERELVDDRELTDETELVKDKEEVDSVELELVGYVEELENLVERVVVEIELLSSSVVEDVEVVELRSEEEIEEENEFVGSVNIVGSVLDVVVSAADVDDVRKNEEVEEIVVFANGPPVDVEESCALLLTSMLVFVMDSEEVKDDVGVAVDGKVNKELDELEEVEVDKETNVVEKKVGSDEVDDWKDDKGEENDEKEVEEEVGVVEDEFEKKVKDEDSALDSESEDVVDDVLGSVDSVVVGAGGTSRKP